jgi:hypothetical protein
MIDVFCDWFNKPPWLKECVWLFESFLQADAMELCHVQLIKMVSGLYELLGVDYEHIISLASMIRSIG